MTGIKMWKWKQPSGEIWNVETDKEKGTIRTIKQNGEVLSEKTELSSESIELIETQFMDVVAPQKEHDPMYA